MILNVSDIIEWEEFSGASSDLVSLDLDSRSGPSPAATEGPSPSPLGAWGGVALCLSGGLIVAENAVVVTVILATPTLRAPVFLLLASLGLADLLGGAALLLHFLFLFCVEESPGSDWSSLLISGLLVTSLCASLCSLLGVALDRYLSLSHALTYGSDQSRRRAALSLALVWFGACTLGAGPALGWNCLGDITSCSVARPLTRTYLCLLCAGFLTVVAATLQLYAGIYRVARRHAHAIATQRHFLPRRTPFGAKHGGGGGGGRGLSRLAVILAVFVGCWMPLSLYGLLGDAWSSGGGGGLCAYAALAPAAGGSLLNPLLYGLRNRDVRRVLKTACCCPHGHAHHPPTDV